MSLSLINHIRKHIELNDDEIKVLNTFIISVTLKRKEFLLQGGQICKSIYFIEKGCVRMYFINNKINEQITQFAIDNWWITDYFSFIDNKPSEYYIQAVERTEIQSINANSFEEIVKKIPQMERYFRINMQRALAASQLRVKYMFELSKEEFYTQFCISFPEFVQRVPQYMIASYLGLTPEYVSELRKKRL